MCVRACVHAPRHPCCVSLTILLYTVPTIRYMYTNCSLWLCYQFFYCEKIGWNSNLCLPGLLCRKLHSYIQKFTNAVKLNRNYRYNTNKTRWHSQWHGKLSELSFVKLTSWALSIDSCKFGENCDYPCHCQNDDVCDSVDGSCPSGCDDGDLLYPDDCWHTEPWSGYGCQFGEYW